MHPNTEALLKFFVYDHLPANLQEISAPFSELANSMANRLDGPELTAGLRKLLEAKDCMVRAALDQLAKDTTKFRDNVLGGDQS